MTAFDKERARLVADVAKEKTEQEQTALQYKGVRDALHAANRRLFNAELALFLFDKRHPFAEGATPANPTPNFPETT